VSEPAGTTTVEPCALTSTMPSVVVTVVAPPADTSVTKPVPRTVAVAAGVRSSNFESAWSSFRTLDHVRPTVCSSWIVMAPLAAAVACMTVIVVAGSISMVDPSRNVTTA
jgi:hypothetical protein